MSAITYGELCYGANKSKQRAKVLEQLEELVQDIPVENLDSKAAEAYGEIRATLEQQGRLVGNNDLWIAGHAMALGVTVATNNEREFRRIAGLSVENWTKQAWPILSRNSETDAREQIELQRRVL